tara:strand:- start:588 stop:1214 length:627 start_codon:yes stop_codon:yes gene_type:complete
METIEQLKPQQVKLDQELHKYTHLPSNEVMNLTVTGVLWALKPQAEKDAIERTRANWEFKGLDIHKVFANYLEDKDLIYWPKHEPYVTPLFGHKFIQEFQPIANEYLMCDPSISLGGSFDALGYWKGKLILLDLKTQSAIDRKPYSTDAQLGGYLHLLKTTTGLVPDEVRTIWCRPGKTTVSPNQGTITCSHAWTAAWQRFQSEHNFQ